MICKFRKICVESSQSLYVVKRFTTLQCSVRLNYMFFQKYESFVHNWIQDIQTRVADDQMDRQKHIETGESFERKSDRGNKA